jgi:trans-aconitate methyltransferase
VTKFSSHWDEVYSEKSALETSWFEESPKISLELLGLTGMNASTSVIDVGAGRSPLAAVLVARGVSDVNALDISEEALRQLDDVNGRVTRIVADVTEWRPGRTFDRWHDRAVLHFLNPEQALAYRRTLLDALESRGSLVLGVFADTGPGSCSGLPVTRYSETELITWLGEPFEIVTTRRHTHHTPWDSAQDFVWVVARRRDSEVFH